MKKYLIFVKHSLPEVQEDRPARDWHLSEEGIQRAASLSERLIQYVPDMIVSSTEPKAVQTAQVIAAKLHLQNRAVADLHEHDRSTTPYLSKSDFEDAVREFFSHPDVLVFGTETANEANERFAQAVNSLLESHQDKTLVVVAHGTVISLFVSRTTGLPDFALWRELGLPAFVVIDRQYNTLIEKANIA